MKPFAKCMLFGAALALAPATALAAAENLGEMEFRSNCAACHGTMGKGDGPMSGYMSSIPSLRGLAKKNGGVFPFERVYRVIDGRADVKGHGTRDMPIWGREYDDKAIAHYRDFYGKYDAESFVRGRILALIVHIHGLQDK